MYKELWPESDADRKGPSHEITREKKDSYWQVVLGALELGKEAEIWDAVELACKSASAHCTTTEDTLLASAFVCDNQFYGQCVDIVQIYNWFLGIRNEGGAVAKAYDILVTRRRQEAASQAGADGKENEASQGSVDPEKERENPYPMGMEKYDGSHCCYNFDYRFNIVSQNPSKQGDQDDLSDQEEKLLPPKKRYPDCSTCMCIVGTLP